MLKRVILLSLVACFLLSHATYAQEPKIAVINMRKVFYEYKKTKNFNQTLENEDKELKKEIDQKTEEIRKLRDEIDLLSEKAREGRQPELREKMRTLEEFRRKKLEEFLRRKDDMFKEIRADILSQAEIYAKKNGYDMIFDKAIYVYSSDKYDVTDNIVKMLNK